MAGLLVAVAQIRSEGDRDRALLRAGLTGWLYRGAATISGRARLLVACKPVHSCGCHRIHRRIPLSHQVDVGMPTEQWLLFRLLALGHRASHGCYTGCGFSPYLSL